ncbi:polysaccharide deacetylase family protein [Gordoniibacillus kamchatkensis]|uniref:polysaccharide deacetylase family protein n=1 Tax=Gordoniibacillus kamchatkensis TaxID=1590651 RepID=UPI0018CF0B82|nr:polysaccharide deacetylase [Paenibacillus sp. VKM B-2647]
MNETKIKWPNGARCAVMLSFDVDAETVWVNGNKHYEGGSEFARTITLGQYGPLRSVPRILELLDQYDLPGTFFVPSWVAEQYPDMFVAIAEKHHEIGNHGYFHERFFDKTYDEQVEIIDKSQEIFRRLIGKEARGFRTPSGDWSVETPKLLKEKGFLYSSSMRGDDRPYRTMIDGEPTGFIEVPTRWELDDYVQFGYNLFPAEPAGQDRISSHEHVLDNFKQEFDGYYRYGLCYVLMMHPQIIGKPGRIVMLDKLIQHMKSYPDVWLLRASKLPNGGVSITRTRRFADGGKFTNELAESSELRGDDYG